MHDANVAFFNLSQEDDGLTLHIVFDINNYHNQSGVSDISIDKKQIEKYLNTCVSWKINGAHKGIKILSIDKDKDHYNIKGKILLHQKTIDSIEIHNTFFNNIEGHSNIIMTDIDNKFRDFRMHSGRTSLLIEY